MNEDFLEKILGRSLANEAAIDALVVTLVKQQPSMATDLIAHLGDQQQKGEQRLDGAALVGFSERLQKVRLELERLLGR